jgi:aarF domain-containing kinase
MLSCFQNAWLKFLLEKKMWPAQRLLKYGVVTGMTIGTLASLKANQYNFDSVGIVRLGRAAVTVSGILL